MKDCFWQIFLSEIVPGTTFVQLLFTFVQLLDSTFVQYYFVKHCTKFQAKWVGHSGTGTQGTWQPMSFTYLDSILSSKFPWHSSLNLARSTCSFYWCCVFSFVIIFTKNIKYWRKNTCYSIAIVEQVYSQGNTCVRGSYCKMSQASTLSFIKKWL